MGGEDCPGLGRGPREWLLVTAGVLLILWSWWGQPHPQWIAGGVVALTLLKRRAPSVRDGKGGGWQRPPPDARLSELKRQAEVRRTAGTRSGMMQVWIGPHGPQAISVETHEGTMVEDFELLVAEKLNRLHGPVLRLFTQGKYMAPRVTIREAGGYDQARVEIFLGLWEECAGGRHSLEDAAWRDVLRRRRTLAPNRL